MGHFAKIQDGIVTQVVVCDSQEWCENNLGGTWIQTSFNTHKGIHYGPDGNPDGGIALHKNFAGIGHTWDGTGFAAPQPYTSWILNTETYIWEAPTLKPEGPHRWVEETLSWVPLEVPTE
jgi:hypothetical protein